MDSNIIIAALTLITTLVSTSALINWRLKGLEEHVKEHNGYAKMFSESTKDIALIKKDIEYIKNEVEEAKKTD